MWYQLATIFFKHCDLNRYIPTTNNPKPTSLAQMYTTACETNTSKQNPSGTQTTELDAETILRRQCSIYIKLLWPLVIITTYTHTHTHIHELSIKNNTYQQTSPNSIHLQTFSCNNTNRNMTCTSTSALSNAKYWEADWHSQLTKTSSSKILHN